MEINLRVPDDYCQGESSTLQSVEDVEYEEDLNLKKRTNKKITPRNRLT